MYQVGSVATVAALSLTETFALGPRIIGGFCGQFMCLAVILCFRWIDVSEATLRVLLMGTVALCSVATGYLDSALLSLCSQYSPKMQRFLQIGIGLGTLVSVLYRDATKLLMAGDVADATSIYFVAALATVLVCIACYQLLMSLPVSRGVGDKDCHFEISSPTPHACGYTPPIDEPVVPEGEVLLLGEEEGQTGKNGGGADKYHSKEATFSAVWREVWRNQAVIFANMFLTTLCYPGMITSIPCRQLLVLRSEHWFQTLLLTAFTSADILGRFFTSFRCGLHHGNIQITILIRAAILPLMLICISHPSTTDAMAFAVVAAFGWLNGYCVSLALIVINEIPRLGNEQRKTCGRISACSVNGGLCLGSVVAAAAAPRG